MTHTAEIFTSSIVAVGSFNPAIFSPDWMEAHRLLGKDDADRIREQRPGASLLVSHQATAFESNWFALQVLENQFSITSKSALSPAFKDLAVSIFQLLSHTPVTAVGLNFQAHYKLSTEKEYHHLGDALAPKDIWNELYPDEDAGLADLTVRIQAGRRGQPLKNKDEKRISLQPSGIVRFGAFLSYNGHHDLSDVNPEYPRPGERVALLIDSKWETAWQDALRVFDGLLIKVVNKSG